MKSKSKLYWQIHKGILLNNHRNSNADETRESAYGLAETLNASLDDMQYQLCSIVDHMNLGTGETNIDMITKILNEHLNSLEWLENKSEEFGNVVKSLKSVENDAWNKVRRN
jgi:hypothetical protein